METRVVKVGGSLLDAPNLPERIIAWLNDQPPARSVFLAGGGGMVDELRRLNKVRPLKESAAHWSAISIMDVTAWLLASWLRVFEITADYAGLQDRLVDTEEPLVFAPGRFLREVEPQLLGTQLTQSWEVTSDSIATRLATVLLADEVVLLKSGPPPGLETGTREGWIVSPDEVAKLAERGFIDRYMPRLIHEAPILRIDCLPDEGIHMDQ